jgi:hypothetical protein
MSKGKPTERGKTMRFAGSPFEYIVSKEDEGYVVRFGNGGYISGPHASKQYAEQCAKLMNDAEQAAAYQV